MKTCKVTITERLELVVEVEASSRTEAESIAERSEKERDHER